MRRGMAAALVVVAALTIGCGGEQHSAGTEPAATTESVTTTASEVSTTAAAATSSEATATAPETAAAPENTEGTDVTGSYFPIGKLPAEFAELEHLLLATIDENGNPAPLNGFLRPKASSAKDYTLVQPALNGRDLTFTTAPVNGVHYTFSGAFQRLGNFSANPPEHDAVVLAGTLTKMRGGQSVASTPVNFGYQAGG